MHVLWCDSDYKCKYHTVWKATDSYTNKLYSIFPLSAIFLLDLPTAWYFSIGSSDSMVLFYWIFRQYGIFLLDLPTVWYFFYWIFRQYGIFLLDLPTVWYFSIGSSNGMVFFSLFKCDNLKGCGYQWNYNKIYTNISPMMLWVRISIRARCTTLCDKVCPWLATGRWFSPGLSVSPANKSDRHEITEILLKVALSTIKQTNTYDMLEWNDMSMKIRCNILSFVDCRSFCVLVLKYTNTLLHVEFLFFIKCVIIIGIDHKLIWLSNQKT